MEFVVCIAECIVKVITCGKVIVCPLHQVEVPDEGLRAYRNSQWSRSWSL